MSTGSTGKEYALDLQIGDSFRDMIHDVINFIPEVLIFLVVLFIGWIIAKILSRIVAKVLTRVKFDKVVERTGITQATNTKTNANEILAKIVYYAILLIALNMALRAFGPNNPASDTLESIIAFIPKLIVAIVIAIIALAVANMARDVISRTIGGLSYGKLLANLAWGGIVLIGGIAALNQVGVATTVTTPVLITILATIGGVIVVGVGGGLIKPMAARWEKWIDSAEKEARTVAATVSSNKATTPTTTNVEPTETRNTQTLAR
jgi:hypothetical protein